MKKERFPRITRMLVALEGLFILLAMACTVTPAPKDGDTPISQCAHPWGDDDSDGRGYYLPNRSVWVNNTSGFPLDVSMWNGGPLDVSSAKRPGDFEIPMVRVNEPGNGWLGLAKVWVDGGGRIARAEVYMNAGYDDLLDPVKVQHVGCMEVGHNFGLGHQYGPRESSSCMNDCARATDWGACMSGLEAQTPNFHDFEQLSIIYETERPEPPAECLTAGLTILITKFPAPGQGGHEHGDH